MWVYIAGGIAWLGVITLLVLMFHAVRNGSDDGDGD